jgi:phosphatidylcholine synthase
VRTARWRPLNLAITILWVVLAGWAVWEEFAPPPAVNFGLGLASVWLLGVGVVMQLFPVRRARG